MKACATGVALVLLMAVATFGQVPRTDPAVSVAELKAGSKALKRATLNDLAALRYSPTADSVMEMIAAGLTDADSDVRLSAIYAAAGRASAARFGGSAEIGALGIDERPQLLRLRPLVIWALTDLTDRVRQGAVIALVNLEYEPGRATNDVLLKEDSAAALRRQFAVESSALVRTEIVKTFALTSLHSRGRDDLLVRAVDDPDAGVAHFAVMGIGRSTPHVALPRVVALLVHGSREVRVQVGQALAAYGAAATPYLGEIAAALTAERDDIVRNTLEGALAAIHRAGR